MCVCVCGGGGGEASHFQYVFTSAEETAAQADWLFLPLRFPSPPLIYQAKEREVGGLSVYCQTLDWRVSNSRL